jgi:hypothetical protein
LGGARAEHDLSLGERQRALNGTRRAGRGGDLFGDFSSGEQRQQRLGARGRQVELFRLDPAGQNFDHRLELVETGEVGGDHRAVGRQPERSLQPLAGGGQVPSIARGVKPGHVGDRRVVGGGGLVGGIALVEGDDLGQQAIGLRAVSGSERPLGLHLAKPNLDVRCALVGTTEPGFCRREIVGHE